MFQVTILANASVSRTLEQNFLPPRKGRPKRNQDTLSARETDLFPEKIKLDPQVSQTHRENIAYYLD
jgi:hypothetical protein